MVGTSASWELPTSKLHTRPMRAAHEVKILSRLLWVASLLFVGNSYAVPPTVNYRLLDLVCEPTFTRTSPFIQVPLTWAFESNCSCKEREEKSRQSTVKIRANPATGQVLAFLISKEHGNQAWWRKEGCKVLDSENWDCSKTEYVDNGIVVEHRHFMNNKQGRDYQAFLYPKQQQTWVAQGGEGGVCYAKQGWSLKGLLGK
jgi:hypothetical protein